MARADQKIQTEFPAVDVRQGFRRGLVPLIEGLVGGFSSVVIGKTERPGQKGELLAQRVFDREKRLGCERLAEGLEQDQGTIAVEGQARGPSAMPWSRR